MLNILFPKAFSHPKINQNLILLVSLTLICTLSLFAICLPARALLRQHHETPGILRYHAQDSVKDRDGNTWQVVLFPDSKLKPTTTYYLRLVGFPGVNSFVHPQSLEIITNQGQLLTATDAYAKSAPASNVGQYDLTSILPQLPLKGNLKLAVPLQNNRELALKISSQVLEEWQLLIQEIEPKKLNHDDF